MPKLHGLEVIQRLREAKSPSKLVILTISHDKKMALWALRAGANGYLVKDGPIHHLLDAIRQIQDGGVYVSTLLRMDYILNSDELDEGELARCWATARRPPVSRYSNTPS